jgi:hypothetical protein
MSPGSTTVDVVFRLAGWSQVAEHADPNRVCHRDIHSQSCCWVGARTTHHLDVSNTADCCAAGRLVRQMKPLGSTQGHSVETQDEVGFERRTEVAAAVHPEADADLRHSAREERL